MIAGIDPSLTQTAAVVGDATSWEVYRFPTKPQKSGRYPRQDHVVNRMARIERILVQLSGALNQWGVGPIYLENYAFRANDGRAQFAVELGGLLRWKLIDFSESAEVYEVAPATLKKFATGRGNASKEQVCAALARRYDVDFKSNDEYDAFGLFRLGLVCEGLEEAATVAQREAANTVQGVKSPKRKKGDDPNQPLLTLT